MKRVTLECLSRPAIRSTKMTRVPRSAGVGHPLLEIRVFDLWVGGVSSEPWLLLGLFLALALGFEFVNGFHDTANAVATVIYTKALPARGGDLVGDLQLRGGPPGRDRRGLQHHPPAAGGSPRLGGLEDRDGDGGILIAGRDPLESGDVVSGPAGLQLAYAHRCHSGDRPDQLRPSGEAPGIGRQLGQGARSRRLAADLPRDRFRFGRPVAADPQEDREGSADQPLGIGRRAAARLDPRRPDRYEHRRERRSWLQ